jgi:hypothetical protein
LKKDQLAYLKFTEANLGGAYTDLETLREELKVVALFVSDTTCIPLLCGKKSVYTLFEKHDVVSLKDSNRWEEITPLEFYNIKDKYFNNDDFYKDVFKCIATESLDRVEPISVFGFNGNNIKLPSYGLENNNNNNNSNNDDDKFVQNGKLGSKSLSTVNELSNLAVGKLIEVTLSDQGISITIPLAIRLIPNELPLSPMLKLLSLHSFDRTFVERFWKWRAGHNLC